MLSPPPFELKIIKTTGDKMQKSSLVEGGLPKGLFTKELEVALLKGKADMAVHSLKDLPTEVPAGLMLAATPKREDVRDVLVYRSADYLARAGLKKNRIGRPAKKNFAALNPAWRSKIFRGTRRSPPAARDEKCSCSQRG